LVHTDTPSSGVDALMWMEAQPVPLPGKKRQAAEITEVMHRIVAPTDMQLHEISNTESLACHHIERSVDTSVGSAD
jgi:hypothetical protein